mgnify:CR=1 FL=1
MGLLLKKSAGSSGDENFRFSRIQTWLNIDSANLTGEGWQINQSLYAIGPGGLLGTGFTSSIQKHFYLPEPQTDFIFSIISEEFGVVGSFIVVILFSIILYRSIKISLNTKVNSAFVEALL